MGLFDGWFGSPSSSPGHLDKLDPQLREFLRRESPVKYETAAAAAAASEQQQQQEQPAARQPQPAAPVTTTKTTKTTTDRTPATETAQTQNSTAQVPSESLFPDGRYAHLWKTYRPLAAVEAETKTDHEKLMDVLEGYKERKARIGRAALENCALEQLDWSSCMKGGDWRARMTMCRDEVRKFERCYGTQSRLLKALGYLSTYDRSPDVDEDIQMHADKLYHQMLAQEAAIEKAKAEGTAVPRFPSLFETAAAAQDPETRLDGGAAAAAAAVPEMSAAMRKTVAEQLDKVAEEDRAAEEAAIRAELKAKAEVAARVKQLWEERAREREARKAEGKETVRDQLAGLLGWR